mgnify:CR=1 FL=1
MNQVKIVAYTQAKTSAFENIEGGEEDFIAYCARVSNPGNQNNTKTAPKLLAYLIKNKHWSPFEMASVTMEITTTRDISRQILRHRSFSFQEFSQRYAQANTFEVREARLQDPTNRQNSVRVDRGLAEQRLIDEKFTMAQHKVIRLTREAYECALDSGIAKEQARSILPLTVYTQVWWTASFQSIMNFIELRDEATAQVEIQEYARSLKKIMLEIFPETTKLWQEVYWDSSE